MFMVMEEVGEMLDALAKFRRKRDTPHDIVTELADVCVMMEQMGELFGWDEFQSEFDRKLHRLKERLAKDKLKRDALCQLQ